MAKELNPELTQYLRSLQRMVYVVTEEEDQFILDFAEHMKDFASQTYVYNSAFGLSPIETYVTDWTKKTHQPGDQTQFNDALTKIYKEEPKQLKEKAGKTAFYIITDPERHLNDPQNVRRVLNLAHQFRHNTSLIKVLIFVGQSKFIPAKLSQYIEVVQLRGLPDEDIESTIEYLASRLGKKNDRGVPEQPVGVPSNAVKLFRGMTKHNIEQSIIQSVVKTKKTEGGPRIDPAHVMEHKRRQLHKTDLVQYLDTTQFSFDHIGGLQRLKEWAGKVKAAWTEEGQEFGLEIPKGVLLVGVYGCGKSLFVKALGNAWGVPVVMMSLGRLRGGLVGESENNLRRALNIIESVSPCIVLIDEAEKEFSGSSSGTNDAGVGSRMLGTISTWMQDTKAQICFAMTANTLNGFPPEIVRRLDDRFFVDIPSDEDRVDILKIHLAKAKQRPSDYKLGKLAKAAELLVGSEIEQCVRAAMRESFHQNKPGLDEKILQDELTSKPRLINTMGEEIASILEWVGYDPERNEGIRARFASDHVADRFQKVVKK